MRSCWDGGRQAANLRSPSQSLRKPTTWFQLGVIGDAAAGAATSPANVRYQGVRELPDAKPSLLLESAKPPITTFVVSNVMRYYAS